MDLDNIMTYTDIVPIYNKKGTRINEVKLPQKNNTYSQKTLPMFQRTYFL